MVPELFVRQADLTPDATAVVDDHARLTYAELDRDSGRVAAALLRGGHGEGSVVGVRMRRGVDLAVGLLGIWKAGACYVGLDPNHPEERIAGILADTGCGLELTDEAVRSFVSGYAPVPPVDVAADSPAYLIFTSGSTGRPKGSAVTHGNITNRVVTTVAGRALTPEDRWLQKSAISFDASVTETFSPLISGGTVIMAPDGAERDATMMLEAVSRHRVTVLQVVPSVLRLLVADPLLAGCTSLRMLLMGGERLSAELCARVWSRLPGIDIWNTYGPSECAVDQTEYLCDRTQTEGPVPIGRPIQGTWLLVLDESGEMVPVGLPGELHVGGAQVGLGYLGNPAMTAERFVPDPLGPPGSRLYRTGDRARWRADGVLEWLGRLDGQTKIDGVRIEPAEIESALLAHPDVTACAVLAVLMDDHQRLVAYVAGDGDTGPTALRAFLRNRLPDYLIPTLFVPIDAMPLTSGGKIDRAVLRALEPERHATARDHVPLESPDEHAVAAVWAELLEVDRVGAEDDFFHLGGHSLLITRLAERLRSTSGRRIEIRDLFASTTVRAQAALLSRVDSPTAMPPVAVPREERTPPSFGQQRLWFLDQLRHGDQEYVVPLFLRVPSSTGQETVQRALDELAARHEVLRTRYLAHDGEPYQVIDAPGAVELQIVDVPADTEAEVFGAELARGFDLAGGPVWRALLVRRPGADGRLLVTLHHIAVDGRSIVVLSDEFDRLCAGEHLPRPLIQYADHAIWQRRTLTGDLLAAQLAYWRAELAALAPLELPVDRPRAAERDSRGAALDFTLPPSVAGPLIEAGRRQGATPFMTLLTVFGVLLGRYSRNWDFAVGTPVSGRSWPEVDDVVGFFLNSLVLRNRVRPDRTFSQALADTRAACTAAFGHADLPFERLVEDVQADRDLSRTPLFQVIFDLHEGEVAGANVDTVDDDTMRAIWRTAKTDLTLIMRRHADGSLQGILEYATALFDEATIERMAANYARLAEELVAAPDVAVAIAPMISPAEHDLLVRRWNDTAGSEPVVPVHRLIAQRAARHPEAIALVASGRTTSCEELELRANRIANLLRGRGVGVESVVGVLLDRGVDLVASLLGIWKAGAAYVPLDPAFPAERVRVVLADAKAEVLITDSELHPLADGFAGDSVLVDRDGAEIAAASATPPAVDDHLDRLAYLIYTSGSTGRPKGVAVAHRGLANYLLWTVEAYAAHGTGGAPLFSSIAFDLGMPNLYTPLLTGQPVHLFDSGLDLTKLGPALADAGPFSFVKLAPAQLELVLHQLEGRPPTPLAALVSAAGDWVSAAMADRWRAVTGQPDTRFMAEYGPTEITVGNSVFDADSPWSGEFLSIGKPIPNTTMYVLDEFLRPAPIGVLGEIFVGGVGVARGYVGNPALTAEKFLPDPFGPPGSRLYRTGDLGRVTATGDVEFRGRADNQVKIRGYRVELGEIEAALLAHPLVREAVLVLDGTEAARQRLVAYYVGPPQVADGLRQFLAERLPAHQVPEVFVPLEALPLTANGKVDRKALPFPGGETAAERPREAPRTEVERRLAEIWSGVLGSAVGVHDNFFALGGHSLTAAKLASMVGQEFDVEIGVRTLFDKPTVAGLAGVLEDAKTMRLDGPDNGQTEG